MEDGGDNSRDVSEETVCTSAAVALAWWVDLLLTLVAAITGGTGAFIVVTLVDLGVGVTQLDGDVALEFVLETDSLDTGDGLDDRGLAVSDMADGADVDGCCTGDEVRREVGLRSRGDDRGGEEGQWKEVALVLIYLVWR